jgi:hypothetical protein
MAKIKEHRDHDDAARQRAVRALWLGVQNDPDSPIHDVAVEFYFAVGKLIEGHSLEAIEFRRIDRQRVLKQHQEG